ncbi:unnamed protein product, partial [Rotaria sp. Silwood1]
SFNIDRFDSCDIDIFGESESMH